jgi:hypothetical protein
MELPLLQFPSLCSPSSPLDFCNSNGRVVGVIDLFFLKKKRFRVIRFASPFSCKGSISWRLCSRGIYKLFDPKSWGLSDYYLLLRGHCIFLWHPFLWYISREFSIIRKLYIYFLNRVNIIFQNNRIIILNFIFREKKGSSNKQLYCFGVTHWIIFQWHCCSPRLLILSGVFDLFFSRRVLVLVLINMFFHREKKSSITEAH